MASPLRVPSFARYAALALAATAASASGPWFYARGPVVRGLPRGYVTYRYRGAPWFFHGGSWYRPWRGGFRGGYPPVGLYIPLLPLGYMAFWFGGVPYYSYEGVYYTDAPSGGYVVAAPPPEEEGARQPAQPKIESPDSAALDALLIIPKEGQNEEKMVADRKEAQRYAMEKSRYDPAYSDPSDPGAPRARQAYLRAMRSYLEERGYSVK